MTKETACLRHVILVVYSGHGWSDVALDLGHLGLGIFFSLFLPEKFLNSTSNKATIASSKVFPIYHSVEILTFAKFVSIIENLVK
jgi:hypothetical protein